MREDLVLPATARRLAQEGMTWEPQIGDWCTVLGASYVTDAQAGLWLVVAAPAGGPLSLVDGIGRWPITQVRIDDCLWLPTAGKLKTWLRARGCRITTGEALLPQLAASAPVHRHLCRLVRPGDTPPIDGEGMNEADAVADALLRLIGADTAGSARGVW